MKIWLDDMRPAPDDTWIWVKDATNAIELLVNGGVTEISFDHDLGTDLSGYDVACIIEQGASLDTIKKLRWSVHSANPVGRANIAAAMQSAERCWRKNVLGD